MTPILPVTVFQELEMLLFGLIMVVIVMAILVIGAISKLQSTAESIRQLLAGKPAADNPAAQSLLPNVRPPSWAGADLRVIEGLPEELNCPHCFKLLVLRHAERRARCFVCPVCEKPVDMRPKPPKRKRAKKDALPPKYDGMPTEEKTKD